MFAIIVIIPLVASWFINVMTYISVNQDARNRRLSRTLSIMVLVFTLSALPAGVVFLTSFSPEIDRDQPQLLKPTALVAYLTAQLITTIILFCNSLWNFFIYNGRHKDFREAYANLKKRLWQNMCNCWIVDSEPGKFMTHVMAARSMQSQFDSFSTMPNTNVNL